jgi:hypothetical protein
MNAEVSENDFALHFDTLNHRFIDFTQVDFFDVQKADYEFSGSFTSLEQHLSDFSQFTFFDSRNA